jgi:uncharacterized membrane protein
LSSARLRLAARCACSSGFARLWLAALGFCALALATHASAERIRDFAAEIHLAPDGSFSVEERIEYDFEGRRRHGIYRDIPVRYQRALGARYHVGLDVESVSDAKGVARTYVVSRSGDSLRIRIGDADREVEGVQEYRIRYRVRRAVLFFPEHDELYWNATGTEWTVPIERASAVVFPPEGATPTELRLACFTGPRGSVAGACEAAPDSGAVRFETTGPLRAGEGLTLVVGLPKGAVREPTAWERSQAWLGDTGILWALLPVGTLLGMLSVWRRFGRDRGPEESVAVRYSPPEGLTPAEVGTVVDERADLADLTATILDLAVRGFLSIEEIDTQRFLFFGSKDYCLQRKRSDPSGFKPHEERLLEGLFSRGDRVLVSELRDVFYLHLPGIRKALYRELSGPGGCFPTSPEGVRTGWAVAGGALAILGLAALATEAAPLPGLVALLASGGVVLAFSRVMPRRTRKGRRALLEIRGFAEFLRRVDADRLERMGGRNVGTFEKLLPFALVLGAADAWAEAFADIYSKPPDWFRSPGGGQDFHPRLFVNRVGQSLGTIGQSLASRPRGSGSGGSGSSGFGGGGMSGGGFGGGGGGSW